MPRPCTTISQLVYDEYKGNPNNQSYPTLEEAKIILNIINKYLESVEYSKGITFVNIKQSLYHRKIFLEEYINNYFAITCNISSLTDPNFTAILVVINYAISRYPRRTPIVFREVSLTLLKDKSPTITWIGNGTFGLRIRTLGANPGKSIITGVILIGSVNTREVVLTLFNAEKICIRPGDCIIHNGIPVYKLCINK